MTNRGQRGFVLLAVVLAITVLAVIAFALSHQGASQVNTAAGEVQRDQLRYVTEAGLQHAKWQLAQNTACAGYSDIPATAFSGDSYSAAFSTNKDSPITIKSTGLLRSGAEFTLQSDAIKAYQAPEVVTVQLDKTAGKDTMIDSFYPNANYGSVDDLTVRSKPSWMQRPLLEFDLTKIPTGVRIVTAKLELQQRIVGTAGVIGVHRVSRSWKEGKGKGTGNADGATWNEYDSKSAWVQPGGDFASTLYATATTTSAKNGRWVAWDIRDLVAEWVSGQSPNYGLMLVGDGVADNAEFQSREEPDPTAAPKLTIAYACECGKVCASGPGKLLLVVGNADSPVGKDSDRKILMESWGYVVMLIDDGESQANFDAAAAANNVIYVTASASGTAVGNKLTGSEKPIVNEPRPMIVEFGFSETAFDSLSTDSFSTTDAAHYITEPYGGSAVTHFTSSITAPVPSGTLAPGLHSVASSGTVTNALPTLEAGAKRWDGTPVAARRVQVPFGEAEVSQLTADGLTLMRRAIEWGAGATTAGKNVLLVVGDPANLTVEQADKKVLMEGWGHTVTMIATSESQAAIDTAAALVDVVYVPELGTGPMGELDTKADGLAVGVITEEARTSIKLGSFSLFPFVDATSINIVDNTHYITEALPTGNVVLSTATQSFWKLAGTLAPDLHVLGQLSGSVPGLAYVDVGETVNDGNPAAGRRIKLPWGSYNFDVNLLTADALDIMKRAIEWGAGVAAAGVGPKKVLFVVGSVGGAGLTIEELAHQALIESWGHTVEIIDDSASQAEFDTAVANNDVVFMTNDITASSLSTKLVDATIGVVTSEVNLSDEFGMASSIAWDSGNVLEINDNTHYITSPFSLGTLTYSSANESLAYVTGTLSTELGQLASSNSGYGLVTLDAGAAMYGGGTADGRRVQLPWGGNGFDPNDLTADGLTILQRALEWGGGAGGVTYAVLMVVADPGSLTPAAADRKTLMESWGYTVTLINDNDSQANFDAGIAASDVVYVGSGTTATTNVNNMLTDITKGVVNEPVGHADTMGLASSWMPVASTDQLTIVNSTHSITQGFASPVTVFTSSLVTSTLSGTLSPDLQNLAEAGAAPSIAVLDSGAARHDVGTSAGRRAQLPFSGAGSGGLTADGQLIVRRAIEWAAGPGGGGGGGGAYIEKHQSWIATSDNTWQTFDLSTFGVPADAVVEVAITNSKDKNERWGGVRAIGSTLERRFRLHEAEGGGVDAVVMHVQANSSSQIQHFAEKTGEVTFTVLGYWTNATYVERFDSFSAGGSNSWRAHNLSAYGVGPSQVAEIAIINTDASNERLAGVRSSGSSMQRLISIHEAESGGIDAATMMVNADASGVAEVYAASDADIDFYVLGYWSDPPGTFVETGGVSGQVSTLLTWEANDLSTFGVPADSVAQFITSNESGGADVGIGVRQTGSSLNRLFNLQEAEDGRSDLATMHVNVDASSRVEWYAQYGAGLRFFYPIGWWVLN